MRAASLRHWGKIGEMEWQMRLEHHQWVYGGKDLESEACGHVLKDPLDLQAKGKGEDGYVHDQSVNASLNENGSHDPSKRMSDLKNADVRSACVHASLHGIARTAEVHWAWTAHGHANGHRPGDCHVRGHGHHEHASDRGENAHYVNDAGDHVHDYVNDHDGDGRP